MSGVCVCALLLWLLPLCPAILRGSCFYDTDCSARNTFCRDRSVCDCKDNYHESGSECVATVGARCQSTSDCSTLANSECKERTCVCREAYVEDSTRYSCLPVASMIDVPCEEAIQCQRTFGYSSECTLGFCKCKQGYHFAGNNCTNSRGLRDSCSKDSECFIGEREKHKVTCAGNVCACRDGYRAQDNTCVDGATTHTLCLVTLVVTWCVSYLL